METVNHKWTIKRNLKLTTKYSKHGNWKIEIRLVKKFEAQRKELANMLSELKFIWDGHVEWISVAKHRIEFFCQAAIGQ